jgi:hypothetical protein
VTQSINIPKAVSKDDAITAKWANSLRRSIRNLANGEANESRRTPYRKTVPPFFVYLDALDGYIYKARVTTGRVVERLAEETNPPIELHEPTNITATENNEDEGKVEGYPLQFEVEKDDYICVTCYVLEDGSIGVDPEENPDQEPVTVTIRQDYDATFPVESYDPNYGSTGVIHYPLAKVVLDRPAGEFGEYEILKLEPMMMGGHIHHLSNLSGEDQPLSHEWKVSFQGETEGPVYNWFVKGGDVVTQGGTFTVADAVITGESGYVLLKITRDGTSREATDATLVVTTEATITTSDYTDQYIALAYVDSALEPDERIKQLKFERIIILEEFYVENGEFKNNSYHVAHHNTYDPPP